MRPFVEELSNVATCYFSCYPNAGLPDPLSPTGFPLLPEDMGPLMRDFAEQGWLNIAGGCCGNTPEHIKCIAEARARCCAARACRNARRRHLLRRPRAALRSAPKFRSR